MLFTRYTSVSFFFEVIGWHPSYTHFPFRQLVMKLSFFISRGVDAHCLPGKHDIIPSLKKNERLLPATSRILSNKLANNLTKNMSSV